MRATFTDAPVTKAVLSMRGGKKGLVINSTNFCVRRNGVRVLLGARKRRERWVTSHSALLQHAFVRGTKRRARRTLTRGLQDKERRSDD